MMEPFATAAFVMFPMLARVLDLRQMLLKYSIDNWVKIFPDIIHEKRKFKR